MRVKAADTHHLKRLIALHVQPIKKNKKALNLAQDVSNDQNQNESIFYLSLGMFYLMKVSFEGNSFFLGQHGTLKKCFTHFLDILFPTVKSVTS